MNHEKMATLIGDVQSIQFPYYYSMQNTRGYRALKRLDATYKTQSGVTFTGLPAELVDVQKYRAPDWANRLQATLAMLPGDKSPHMHVADANSHYDLKRLTPENKKYILNWIYDTARTCSRSPHEEALFIMNALSGANSADFTETGPFEPKLGALEKTTRIIKYVMRAAQQLGVPDGFPDSPEEVLRRSGASTQPLEQREKGSLARDLFQGQEILKETIAGLEKLGDALVRHKYLNPNTTMSFDGVYEDLAGLHKTLVTAKYRSGPNVRWSSYIRIDSPKPAICTLLTSIRGAQIASMNEKDMDAFIDELVKVLTRRIKTRQNKE